MKLILISGYKRSGKDFIATHLKKVIGGNTKVMSFATPIKEILATTLGITLDELDDYKNDSNDIYVNDHPTNTSWASKLTDFRTIMQKFGTEAMQKEFGEDVWIEQMVRNLPPFFANGVVIIPDWRFKREYERLAIDYDIITVRVDGGVATSDHISETELLDFNFDYRIDNTKQDTSVFNTLKDVITTIDT